MTLIPKKDCPLCMGETMTFPPLYSLYRCEAGHYIPREVKIDVGTLLEPGARERYVAALESRVRELEGLVVRVSKAVRLSPNHWVMSDHLESIVKDIEYVLDRYNWEEDA